MRSTARERKGKGTARQGKARQGKAAGGRAQLGRAAAACCRGCQSCLHWRLHSSVTLPTAPASQPVGLLVSRPVNPGDF